MNATEGEDLIDFDDPAIKENLTKLAALIQDIETRTGRKFDSSITIQGRYGFRVVPGFNRDDSAMLSVGTFGWSEGRPEAVEGILLHEMGHDVTKNVHHIRFLMAQASLLPVLDGLEHFSRTDPVRAEGWMRETFGSIAKAQTYVDNLRSSADRLIAALHPLAGKTDVEILGLLESTPHLLKDMVATVGTSGMEIIFSSDGPELHEMIMDLNMQDPVLRQRVIQNLDIQHAAPEIRAYFDAQPLRNFTASPEDARAFDAVKTSLQHYRDSMRDAAQSLTASQRAEEYLVDRFALRHSTNPQVYFDSLSQIEAIEADYQNQSKAAAAAFGVNEATHPTIMDRVALGNEFLISTKAGLASHTPEATRPNVNALRQAAIERIQFFEQALGERGIRVRMGAELEFVPLNEHGLPEANLLDEKALTRHLRQTVPGIERVHREPGSQAGYELVTGPNSAISAADSLTAASPQATAETVAAFKDAMLTNAQRWGLGGVSFAPRVDANGIVEKNGAHINMSLWDVSGGHNLFYASHEKTTDLQRHVIAALIRTHAEGAAAYLPHLDSYVRIVSTLDPTLTTKEALYDMLTGGPNHAGHKANKGADLSDMLRTALTLEVNSVASRYGGSAAERTVGIIDRLQHGPNRSSMIAWETPEQHRIESRLAGADADPYVLVAMEVGAAYEAVTNHVRPYDPHQPINSIYEKLITVGNTQFVVDIHDGTFDSIAIPRNLEEAQSRIAGSQRLQGLLGSDLYNGILAYTDPAHVNITHPLATTQHETTPVSSAVHDALNSAASPVRPAQYRGKDTLWGKAIQGIASIGNDAPPNHLLTSHTAMKSSIGNGIGVAMGAYGLIQKFGDTNSEFNQDMRSGDAWRQVAAGAGVVIDGSNIGVSAVSTAADIQLLRESQMAAKATHANAGGTTAHPTADAAKATNASGVKEVVKVAEEATDELVKAGTEALEETAKAGAEVLEEGAKIADAAPKTIPKGDGLRLGGKIAGRAAIPIALVAGTYEGYQGVQHGDRERVAGAVGSTAGGILGGIAVGFAAGAIAGGTAGSVVPVAGTIVVGVVAGIAGGVAGAFIGEAGAKKVLSSVMGKVTGVDDKIKDVMKGLDPKMLAFLDQNGDRKRDVEDVHLLLKRGGLDSIDKLDTNHDKKLSSAELARALNGILLDKELSERLAELNAKGWGKVLGDKKGPLTLAELKAALPKDLDVLKLDTKHNGDISGKEITDILNAARPSIAPAPRR